MKLGPKEVRQIVVNFSKLNEMNVYVYGGKNRYDSTVSITEGNDDVKIGKNYSIPVETGMLIVAYPNENVDDTTFEFSYQVVTGVPVKDDEGGAPIVIIIVVVIVLAIIIVFTIRHFNNKNKIEILSTPNPETPQL